MAQTTITCSQVIVFKGRASGGIGRRAGFRFQSRKGWRFESSLAYHFLLDPEDTEISFQPSDPPIVVQASSGLLQCGAVAGQEVIEKKLAGGVVHADYIIRATALQGNPV